MKTTMSLFHMSNGLKGQSIEVMFLLILKPPFYNMFIHWIEKKHEN